MTPTALAGLDYLILAAYFALILAVGFYHEGVARP